MQTVEDFLDSGGAITKVKEGVKAVKAKLSMDQIAEAYGITYDSKSNMFIDGCGNWVPVGRDNKPNWEACE